MVNRRSIALFGAIVMMMTLISCGPATSQYMVRKNAGELKAVDGNMCKIVFMRPGKYAEGAAPIILDSNGKYIGEGLSKTYFIVTLPAGKYTFIAWGEGTHSMSGNFKAGKTYFVRIGVHIGMWAPRFQLVPLKPNTEMWAKKDDFLGQCEYYEVDREAGQKNLVDPRAADAKDVVVKGLKKYEEYSAEEKAERTINPEDGI